MVRPLHKSYLGYDIHVRNTSEIIKHPSQHWWPTLILPGLNSHSKNGTNSALLEVVDWDVDVVIPADTWLSWGSWAVFISGVTLFQLLCYNHDFMSVQNGDGFFNSAGKSPPWTALFNELPCALKNSIVALSLMWVSLRCAYIEYVKYKIG